MTKATARKAARRAADRERRAAAAAARRAAEREQRVAAAAEAARAAEERAETIAPAVQRRAVRDAKGHVLRGARLEPDGAAFRVSNSVRTLYLNGQERGSSALVRHEHVIAAERLARSWEDGGRGVSMAASRWGESSERISSSGSMSEAVLRSIGYQNAQRDEFNAVRAAMGTAWPVLLDIVLQGLSVNAWAEREGMERKIAVGYLVAGLDRLADFYAATEQRKRQPRMRAVGVVDRSTK